MKVFLSLIIEIIMDGGSGYITSAETVRERYTGASFDGGWFVPIELLGVVPSWDPRQSGMVRS